MNKPQFSAEQLHSNIATQLTKMITEMINLLSLAGAYFWFIGDRNKISDLVHSEVENQCRAKKPAATITAPIGRFLVPIDKNQQTKQKTSENKSGQ